MTSTTDSTISAAETATVHPVYAQPVFASTTTTVVATRPIRSSADYGVAERFVAALGLGLLRWSNRRADRAHVTHERMALILENERVRAGHGPFAPCPRP